MSDVTNDMLSTSPIYKAMPPISRMIWDDKYRLKHPDGTPIDITPEGTLRRVARFLAGAEGQDETTGGSDRADAIRDQWADTFYSVMETFEFMPAGRIVAGAGAGRNVTLSNCYVMGTIPDSMEGIFDHLKEAALTMQAGGGIGYDFSTIRPKGAEVKGVGAFASGPLSFMDCWDSMCRTVMSAGSRRGAMMATMICTHPDIEAFIDAKHDPLKLRNFNVSVMVTDAFMKAVADDDGWNLVHAKPPVKGPRIEVEDAKGNVVYVHKTVRARDLWNKITRNTFEMAEPGIMFIDRVNRLHNLWWIDDIRASNPCGEKFMGPYDSCLLGSVNLAMFVRNAFRAGAFIDYDRLAAVVKIAIRLMDNVIDVNFFPLDKQAKKARETRQLGLGITGLADMLVMLGQTYGSEEAAAVAEHVMKEITINAYWASVELAMEKGCFPVFDKIRFLGGDNFAAEALPEDLKTAIEEVGIRNSLLTSIAPTGTISLFMNNVSSGMEPIFAYSYTRKVLQDDGSKVEELVEDYAVKVYREGRLDDSPGGDLPSYFVSAQTLTPADHVRMQGALQKWVDSSISKTINCPEDISFEDFQNVYQAAWEAGCKGCTTYRPNEVTGSVLSVASEPKAAPAAVEPASAEEAPQSRPDALPGAVYKIKLGSEHAIYVTVTDIEGADGRRRPFEVFISTKNPEHFAWTTALTRMISAVFRRPHNSSFVVEELKAVFAPSGGGFWRGRYWPSEVAAIGQVIEDHMVSIGYLDRTKAISDSLKGVPVEALIDLGPVGDTEMLEAPAVPKGPVCPSCFSTRLKKEAGCFQCLDCGNSKCG